MIADGVAFGTLEAHGKAKRADRPWAADRAPKRGNLVRDLARMAQKPGAARLAPIPFASPDGPVRGGVDVSAEIARLRAEAVAAARLN